MRSTDEPELRAVYEKEDEVRGARRSRAKRSKGSRATPARTRAASSSRRSRSPTTCRSSRPRAATLVTQFDKDDVEAVGLVKFDFLGLRTLTIIDRARQGDQRAARANAAKRRSTSTRLPMDDATTYDVAAGAASTTAVFQLESRGMRDLVKKLQPDTFEDIIALVALFRPGPLQIGHGRDSSSQARKDARGRRLSACAARSRS